MQSERVNGILRGNWQNAGSLERFMKYVGHISQAGNGGADMFAVATLHNDYHSARAQKRQSLPNFGRLFLYCSERRCYE